MAKKSKLKKRIANLEETIDLLISCQKTLEIGTVATNTETVWDNNKSDFVKRQKLDIHRALEYARAKEQSDQIIAGRKGIAYPSLSLLAKNYLATDEAYPITFDELRKRMHSALIEQGYLKSRIDYIIYPTMVSRQVQIKRDWEALIAKAATDHEKQAHKKWGEAMAVAIKRLRTNKDGYICLDSDGLPNYQNGHIMGNVVMDPDPWDMHKSVNQRPIS